MPVELQSLQEIVAKLHEREPVTQHRDESFIRAALLDHLNVAVEVNQSLGDVSGVLLGQRLS